MELSTDELKAQWVIEMDAAFAAFKAEMEATRRASAIQSILMKRGETLPMDKLNGQLVEAIAAQFANMPTPTTKH